MHFAQIYIPGIAQCSYVLGSGKKCVVVDPVRDIGPYLEQAKEFGMEIVAILETHLHADFLSGHMELAEKTGAKIYAPQIANCTFPHKALVDGEEFTVENLRFTLLETPGHTPDCSVYVVSDMERGNEPVLVFTGDTLLVGDVGRPDLFPSREEELAEKLYASLARLKELPDHLEVYPAHGMGSLCGRALSAKLWSTIGTERRHNYALQYTDVESFKDALLKDMPSAPDHFARCSQINRQGPQLLQELSQPQRMVASDVNAAVEKGVTILDTRSYLAFAASHIPRSYSISKYGNLATFAGWVIPPEDDLILVLERPSDLSIVMKALYNVGLDHILGYLDGSVEAWINHGLPVEQIETISLQKLHQWQQNEPPLILDTRAKNEWKVGHIPGTQLAPAPDIRTLHTQWDPEQPVIVLCNTSNRSMTAASLLKRQGFKRVINAVGGTTAWTAQGLPMYMGENS
ncbi:MAG: rhodanese-like domain-containing protein [Firmicutes bacterium]|nr:rhodanese-like domain-containing protein [Bacillota bacterium]